MLCSIVVIFYGSLAEVYHKLHVHSNLRVWKRGHGFNTNMPLSRHALEISNLGDTMFTFGRNGHGLRVWEDDALRHARTIKPQDMNSQFYWQPSIKLSEYLDIDCLQFQSNINSLCLKNDACTQWLLIDYTWMPVNDKIDLNWVWSILSVLTMLSRCW